jgi:plastocyanin
MDISGFTFSAITVKPGATVTVTNADSVAHLNVPGGGQATFTAPTKPGSYPLTCDFHPRMHGMLTVAA